MAGSSTTKVTVLLCTAVLTGSLAYADQELVATGTDQAPIVDGSDADDAWATASEIITRDFVADIEIHLRSLYTAEEIFFLVRYPDDTENREHKTMVWDPAIDLYVVGPSREDTFVFKWNMEPFVTDLSLASRHPYKADIWFWKAFRTDHAGAADDKMHIYSVTPLPRASRVLSRTGQIFYLLRPGDDGEPAYRPLINGSYNGPTTQRYAQSLPSGSRADVRAKGAWRNGWWTIEFARKLRTGNTDDITLDPGQTYLFGVSRYEIAGRKPDPDLQQPKYGSGEVGEKLRLRFQ